MVKTLQKIGNSRGIVLDRPILKLLNVDSDNGAFEITQKNGGLFLKPLDIDAVYDKISKRHRKSLDKLAQ